MDWDGDWDVGAGDVQSAGILWDVFFLPRICYTDTSSPQEDQYPPNIAVKVNHSYCSVPVRTGGFRGKAGGIWGENCGIWKEIAFLMNAKL